MDLDVDRIFSYPYDFNLLLRKQKVLRRMLLSRLGDFGIEKRIAILGGSTTNVVKNNLELFLLYSGIKPCFYESDYNKYYEDAVFHNDELDEFQPEIIIMFTSVVNIISWPIIGQSTKEVQAELDAEYRRYKEIWSSLSKRYSAIIIQNNMDLPWQVPMGSLEAVECYGINRYVESLNEMFSVYASKHDGFYIHDLHGLSARIGLQKWHNRFQYYSYKFAMDYDCMPEVALGLAKIIRGILGRNKKCIVLDLDNTLWGGVIGDEGLEGIRIGHETPEAEAYTAFQEYLLELKKRGVILAVCSKNEESVAKSGFDHPDSILHLSDFVSFRANWEPKDVNIKAISEDINIGMDSIVFIDDNPAERQIVRDTFPEISVPEVDPLDVFSYIRAIEGAGYFETVKISEDDKNRSEAYVKDKSRRELERSTGNYDEFLKSLEMKAEIRPFQPIYYDRIAQLTNKTNQFNLTTRRYTRADIERMAQDDNYVTLYGKLTDKFGDNGLISVVIAEKKGRVLHILLWLMSCRVLRRGMEYVMMDALAKCAIKTECDSVIGYYYPTPKNCIVKDMFKNFGFSEESRQSDVTIWKLILNQYEARGKFIEVSEDNE